MSILEQPDIIRCVIPFLSDKENVALMQCSIMHSNFRFTFHKKMALSVICYHRNFDAFVCVVMDYQFANMYDAPFLCGRENTLTLPKNTKQLIIESPCRFLRSVQLPSTLTHLNICCLHQDTSILRSLFMSITHIGLRSYTNSMRDILPPAVTHLEINGWMEHDATLLNTITHLIFGPGFDNCIDNLIAPSVTHMTLGYNFDRPISNLPASITHLSFGANFNRPIDNLSLHIVNLKLGRAFNQNVNKLPKTLKYLSFGACFNKKVEHLPQGLMYLKLGHGFNKPINNLPRTLMYLKLGNNFNQPVDYFPPFLTHVKFGYNFNQSVSLLPDSVTHLYLGYSFDQKLTKLPASLQHLTLSSYKHSIKHLPLTITIILR